MNFVNQYSFVWLAIFLATIVEIVLLCRRSKWPQVLTFGALLIGLVFVWIILHPRRIPQADDAAQVRARIEAGLK